MAPEFVDDYGCWRYVLQGMNLNGNWMKVIIAHHASPPEEIMAITGFRYSRGKKS